MGWPELWRILASPIIAAAMLAVGYIGLRKARFDFSRLPSRSIRPLVTVLMAGASSVVLVLLFANPPAPASGQTPTPAPAVSGIGHGKGWGGCGRSHTCLLSRPEFTLRGHREISR